MAGELRGPAAQFELEKGAGSQREPVPVFIWL